MRLINISHVSYTFEGSDLGIIEDISFAAQKGELISVIGPSGCGKSTLLRMIAGLVRPTTGSVYYMNKEVTEPNSRISFVFQDFALMPWLTNLENVKLGLSFSKMNDEQKNRKAAELLDRFGLDGFDDYYPNALSGGMKQRVGIARAIASEPQVLLMDEPFSSLDELTANTLRADIIYMLENRRLPVNSVIMVTHNVNEAVELSDKIVILTAKPSRIKEIIEINRKRPRDTRSREFQKDVDRVYAALAR